MAIEKPLVSVLMTSYNREKYIAEAIESVLSSTYQNFELIIVDDQSKDNTVEIAKSFAAKCNRVRVYVNEQNLGDYSNRNMAASYATGKYIKYLDSDDIIYPHCLEVMVNAMERFPDAGYGLSSTPNANLPFPYCLSPKDSYLEHFSGFSHFHRSPGSSIIKSSVFRDVGGFSGTRHIGDQELWFKLSQMYSLVTFPRDLYWSRTHQNSESAIEASRTKSYTQIRNRLVLHALSSEQCPLSQSEIFAIKKILRKNNMKNDVLQKLHKLTRFLR